MSCKNVESNTQLNEYVTELDYDLVDGKKFDARIKIEAEIFVAGNTEEDFAKELEDLIAKYRI